jgi:hypothetical protein
LIGGESVERSLSQLRIFNELDRFAKLGPIILRSANILPDPIVLVVF